MDIGDGVAFTGMDMAEVGEVMAGAMDTATDMAEVVMEDMEMADGPLVLAQVMGAFLLAQKAVLWPIMQVQRCILLTETTSVCSLNRV